MFSSCDEGGRRRLFYVRFLKLVLGRVVMRKVFGWSAVSLLVLGGVANAQVVQPRQPNVRPGTQPGNVQQPGAVQPGNAQRQPGGNQNQQHQHQQSDQQIAEVIVACNRAEVEMAKFAMPKLQSSEAKEVATMLIKDHTETANKFSKWAGQGANVNTSTQPGAGSREEGRREDGRREENRNEEGRNDRRDDDQSRTAPAAAPNATAAAANQTALQQGAAQPGQPANQPGTIRPGQPAQPGQPAANQPHVALKPATGGVDWVAIHREVANECVESSKKELSRYDGNEFDKAFLGHQTGGHLASIANLKVLKRHASSELGSEIDGAIEGAESHLKKLRELMEEKKDEKNK
jgi:predicted outer membrane protein